MCSGIGRSTGESSPTVDRFRGEDSLLVANSSLPRLRPTAEHPKPSRTIVIGRTPKYRVEADLRLTSARPSLHCLFNQSAKASTDLKVMALCRPFVRSLGVFGT